MNFLILMGVGLVIGLVSAGITYLLTKIFEQFYK